MIAKITNQIISSLGNSSLQVSLQKSQLKKPMQRNLRLQGLCGASIICKRFAKKLIFIISQLQQNPFEVLFAEMQTLKPIYENQ